jgi:hypothetical protein
MVENGENPILSHHFLDEIFEILQSVQPIRLQTAPNHIYRLLLSFFNFAVILSHIIG